MPDAPIPDDPLLEEAVLRAAREAPATDDPLALARFLRARLPAERARAAAELVELRRRARGRLGETRELVLTRKATEQATPRAVALERARTIRDRAPDALVLDATAGIGGDALPLAASGLSVVAADRDERLARYLAHNLRARGLPPRVVCADAAAPPLGADVLLLDPDRRPAGARRADPEAWSPAWSTCARLARDAPAGCVKLPPGADVARLERRLAGELERSWVWTSWRGELREVALLWGALADGRPEERTAVAIDADGVAHRSSGTAVERAPLDAGTAAEVEAIAEPDPAVIRAGLVGRLAAERGLAPLGPGLAYLGGARPRADGRLRAWRVVASAPLDRRRVRAMLRSHDVGPLVVKKRGHPLGAGELARRHRGEGRRRGILVVARLARGHRAYLVEPFLEADRPRPRPGGAASAAGDLGAR